MDTQNPSAPSRARSRIVGNTHPNRVYRRGGGLLHDNSRHTVRFTVIGNHLTQHADLSLLAIGLGCHIQSLPKGARVDIKSLAARFPEGAVRIAAGLRELEKHGYLRRERERVPGGRIITRTVSCNQPATRHPHRANGSGCGGDDQDPRDRSSYEDEGRTARPDHQSAPPSESSEPSEVSADVAPGGSTSPDCAPSGATSSDCAQGGVPSLDCASSGATSPDCTPSGPRTRRKALPAVPVPSCTAPALFETAARLLADLRRSDVRLLLSTTDTAHLTPGVAAWLERDVTPTAVRHALTTGLPDGPLHRPAALLAHRLTALLPPPPPFRPAAAPPPVRHPLQTCDGCERVFRAADPGLCRDCREWTPEGVRGDAGTAVPEPAS
ncbi:helix-turn-helix domain-containing protein [Streptomyces sp. NPDC026659]|uniref:helix-turn-helix domain-containing protein n=1 Tax=Streptomyces sp. NPDC026659 TaxID=3155123 RepID=UPI0033E3EDA0